jgi:hypothetical protein
MRINEFRVGDTVEYLRDGKWQESTIACIHGDELYLQADTGRTCACGSNGSWGCLVLPSGDVSADWNNRGHLLRLRRRIVHPSMLTPKK